MTKSMPFSTSSSGDFIADRRYAYGDAAMAENDFTAARDLFAQTLERVPDWPPAHFALARACLALADEAAAADALRRVLVLDPGDRLGAGVVLARIAGGEAGREAMPDAYVASLFDEYAPRFDSHLIQALDYRAPQMLAALLREIRHGEPGLARALDLGCGTGLMAKEIRAGLCECVGVDLSAGMLRVAAATGLYDRLEKGELLAFLATEPEAGYDLVLAADVFCYVPDLAPVFAEAVRVLKPGGCFAFSIQTHEGSGVVIGADSRVHHPVAYIRALAAAAGLNPAREAAASTRQDRGIPVAGALFAFTKTASRPPRR